MKKLLCFALNIVMAATLVSCKENTGGGSDVFTPSLDKQTKCSIKVVGHYSNFKALEDEFDRFNVYYPKVTLSYQKVNDYENTLATVLEGRDKPNIFFSEPKMMGNEKFAAVASHMEELSDSSLQINFDCLRSNLINHDASGKTYMVPIFSRTYGALVNKNLFAQENLELPTTWQELLDVCEEFREKGYESPMMGYTKNEKYINGFMCAIAYPYFLSELANHPGSVDLANALDPSAGEYMRKGLTTVKELVDAEYVDFEGCDLIGDNYEKLLLRFFEGDVPMMVCYGDTVSGAKSRESKSAAYTANPFKYSFYPIPVTDQGGFFIDSPSVEFSVNKDCDNLDMTNEFMRFLIRTKELDEMAAEKGLIAPTKTVPFEPNYAAFNDIPAERTFSPEELGLKEQPIAQIRLAAYKVGKGILTVEQAIEQFGSLS